MRPVNVLLTIVTFSLTGAQAALTWKTQDISATIHEEADHISYRDTSGTARSIEQIVKSGGANSIKIRLFVNPSDGRYSLDYGLKLGDRAKAAGLSVSLNLHYSDTWANPGQQTPPAAWAGQSVTTLASTVKTYTQNTVAAFVSRGINVDIVWIGNEIRGGLLWPTGKYDNFPNMGRLLTAAYQGAKAAKSSVNVGIHLDRGYSWGDQQWFYDSLVNSGTWSLSNVDVQGVSYYPFWSKADSGLDNFKTTVNNMANKYKKKIIVVETNWPVKCSNPKDIPDSLLWIPFSAAGQITWFQQVANVVNAIPNGLGVGIMNFEPGWVSNTVLGSSCEDSVMFDADWSGWPNNVVAKARSSINVFNNI